MFLRFKIFDLFFELNKELLLPKEVEKLAEVFLEL